VALCEYGFTAVMFLLYHITASLLIFIANSLGSKSPIFAYSILDIVLTLGAITTVIVLFVYKPT
jgi:hypothetical protein